MPLWITHNLTLMTSINSDTTAHHRQEPRTMSIHHTKVHAQITAASTILSD